MMPEDNGGGNERPEASTDASTGASADASTDARALLGEAASRVRRLIEGASRDEVELNAKSLPAGAEAYRRVVEAARRLDESLERAEQAERAERDGNSSYS